ncbi:MAG: aminoacyl-tRNA hydrolase [Spirochaetia bacterium]
MGLGNPGPRFHGTRHNVGFAVVEETAARLDISLRKPLFARYRVARQASAAEAPLVLAEPLTYMNRSGDVLPRLLRRAGVEPEAAVVVCDNLDLPAGRLRMKRGGGTAGHRGLASIVDAVGHGDFLRLYIGIGRPEDGDVVAHVLGSPPEAERTLYAEAVSRAADAVLLLRRQPPEQVMNELNRRQE